MRSHPAFTLRTTFFTAIVASLAAVTTTACTSGDTCSETSDGESVCFSTSIVSGTGAAAVKFDRLELFYGVPGGDGVAIPKGHLETPDIIAGRAANPATYNLAVLDHTPKTYTFATPQTDYLDEFWEDGIDVQSKNMVAAIAWSGDTMVGVGQSPINEDFPMMATAELAIEPLTPASASASVPVSGEVWGLPGTYTNPATQVPENLTQDCARGSTATGPAFYFVRRDDVDCDGIVDELDCQPDVFCDPADTTPAGLAACSCNGITLLRGPGGSNPESRSP